LAHRLFDQLCSSVAFQALSEQCRELLALPLSQVFQLINELVELAALHLDLPALGDSR
jgi:hypothetical protein